MNRWIMMSGRKGKKEISKVEICKLKYRNSIWLNFYKNIELKIKRLKSGKFSVCYYNWEKSCLFKVVMSGAEAAALDKKFPTYPLNNGRMNTVLWI